MIESELMNMLLTILANLRSVLNSNKCYKHVDNQTTDKNWNIAKPSNGNNNMKRTQIN